jgi:hypothetical protein
MQQKTLAGAPRRGRAQAVAGVLTLAVLVAVPALAVLFLGSPTFEQGQPVSDPVDLAGPGAAVTADFLVLGGAAPARAEKAAAASAAGGSAADREQVETLLNRWVYTSSPPTLFF